MDDRNGRAIIAVDLLRFACALLVVCFHFFTAFARGPSPAGARMLAGLPVGDGSAWSWAGWVGVEIFFVISGLVIATSAEGAPAASFVRRRALRLVPAVWICGSVTAAVLAVTASHPDHALSWLRSMAFWPLGMQIDPSYWTLGIECLFYIVIALCLGGGGNPRRIEARAVMLGWWSTAFWLAMVASGSMHSRIFDYRAIELLLLPYGCFFAMGVLARGALRDGWTRARAVPFAIFLAAGLAEIVARTIERTTALQLTHGPWLPLALFLTGLAVILTAPRTQPWLARHVRPSLAVRLGLMTYPLYLIHQEVGAAMIAALMHAGAGFGVAAAVTLAAMVATAWLVVAVPEPVIRARLAALLSRRRGPAPDTRRSAFPRAG